MCETGNLQDAPGGAVKMQQTGIRVGLHGTRVRGCAEGLQRSNRSATATCLREDGGEILRR